MAHDEAAAAVRRLLGARPDLELFYLLDLEYIGGSTGYLTFHALSADAEACRATIQELCAQLKAERDRLVAELNQLPEDEQPYDPALPAGCYAALCFVLPDRQRYVLIHRQRWNLWGRSDHPPLIPDIFAVAYYRDKVRAGEYGRFAVRPLGA